MYIFVWPFNLQTFTIFTLNHLISKILPELEKSSAIAVTTTSLHMLELKLSPSWRSIQSFISRKKISKVTRKSEKQC